MSKEKIFNIFPIVIDEIISSIGYKTHLVKGDDSYKIDFLKKNIDNDLKDLKYVSIPIDFNVSKGKIKRNGISLLNYNNLILNNQITILFENIFITENASKEPLFVATLLDDKCIRIDETIETLLIKNILLKKSIMEEIPEDYFTAYHTEEGFDFSNLLNDDFLKASKLLYQNGLYVSALKLLLSAIDSFAFLEYGDSRNIFKKWIDTYCTIDSIGINSDELWEYRNSLLHMTNNKSRKVLNNSVAPISFYVTSRNDFIPTAGGNLKYFNLFKLIQVITNGMVVWIDSFDKNPEKIELFFKKYDLIISDVRYSKTYFGD